MEENNILNKNNKKKILIGSIIIVMVLLLVVVGSTYAYFSTRINGEGTSTKVTITTGSSKQIKLSGGLEDFHIKLDVIDMAYNRIDSEYYATSDSILPYVTNKDDGLTDIGKVEVIGELEEKHVCTAKAKVNLSGDMATLIREGDLEISLVNGIYTNITDLTKIVDNNLASLEFVITDKSTQYIKAYLKFTNRDKEQNYLAKQELNVSIIIDDFKCTTDTTAPVIDKIYFNEDTSEQHYTNVLNNTLHMSWLDEDVKEYCITQEDTTQCIWKPTDGKQSIEEPIQLEDVEKDHLYNGYLKDNAGNISLEGTASIIYDKTLPTINSFYIKEEESSKYTNQIKNKVYITYNDTNIKDMCVTEETTSTNCKWTTISESMDYTFANNNEGIKTIYGYVRDKAGNISSANMTSSIIYDVTPPTVTNVTAPNPQETSLTLSITANDNKTGVSTTSGIDKYCYSTSNSSSESSYTCGTSSSITVNNLQAGTSYTFYVYAKDKAGNSGITNRVNYTFTTKAKPLKNVLSEADKNSTLQSSPFGGLYRYKGTASQVKYNYICFGTTDVNECSKTSPDTYMYRIIGVTDGSKINTDLGLVEGQLKIIKAILSTKQEWYYTSSSNIPWKYSYIYEYLNGTEKNTQFLYNIRIGNNGTYWDSLITSQNWYMEINDSLSWPSTNPTPNTKNEGKIGGKIGLMYASDYYNSGSQSTTNWLFITNGASTSSKSAEYEWTMTRYGQSGNDYDPWFNEWYIGTMGGMSWANNEGKFAVRPVFYLTPNITLSGEGTEGNPFIIHS